MRAALLLLALLSMTACVLAATTDCTLKAVTVTPANDPNPAVWSPKFSRTIYSYKMAVASNVDTIYITGYTNVQTSAATGGEIRIGYYQCAGTGCGVKAVGTTVPSGQSSSAIPLAVGVNKVGINAGCSSTCQATYYITITRAANSMTKGDPIFVGLLGQVFQVHGVAGEVYSIVSDPVMQMNSRFVFLDGGECPVLNGKKAHACWSHPGSYLGELGVQTCSGQKLLIRSGGAAHGFASVQLDGKDLDMDSVLDLNCELPANGTAEAVQSRGYVVRNSTHLVTMQLSNFLFHIENSDMFVNYKVKVLDWANLAGTHGLLGQTYRKPLKPGKWIKDIEGSVDMYQIEGASLWGNTFDFNQFHLTNNATQQHHNRIILQ